MLTTEALQKRKEGLGGSDVAAAIGLSPYKTPVDLWLEKTGQREPDDLSDNERVHFGNVLEDVVAAEFSRRTGLQVRRDNRTLFHPEHGYLLAHIDRAVVGRSRGFRAGLECKTAGTWAANPDLWGEGAELLATDTGVEILREDDRIPDWYLVQCAHYMAVTNSDLWFLAVLIGGNDFRVYTIHRDIDLEETMIRRAGDFWWNNVKANIPPEAVTAADLAALYPRDNGRAVEASLELVEACQTARQLQDTIKAQQSRLDDLKNKIRAGIGENAELLVNGDQTLATWKSSRPSQVFDRKAFQAAHPDLYKEFTTEQPGSRRLLLK